MDPITQTRKNGYWEIAWQLLAFAAVLLGIKLFLIATYGNATPFWDQWDAEAAYLYRPYLDGDLAFSDLLRLHNEHRIFTTRILALVLLTINGIWNPLLQMVVNACIHVLVIGIAVTSIARVVGKQFLPAILVFSLALFAVPYGWENTLAGFQSQFYFVLLFSLLSLWLTVTQAPLSARWWGGIVCAVFAFFSLASGIFGVAASAAVGAAMVVLRVRHSGKHLLAIGILAGLFVLGAWLTPSLEVHAYLKAKSFQQFLEALMAVLGWPMSQKFSTLLAALFRNAPAFLFAICLMRERPAANDRRWYLFALVVWTLGQAASIAYGRATGSLAPRYLDLFALGILVDFACLVSLTHQYMGTRRRWAVSLVGLWLAVVFSSLGFYAADNVTGYLNGKQLHGRMQETNTRNFLASGNIEYLTNKPDQHVPYPNAARLAGILSAPSIQKILPSNIRKPAQDGEAIVTGRLDGLTSRILGHYTFFILLGFVIVVGVLVQKQLGSKKTTTHE